MPSGKHKRYEKSYFNDLNNEKIDFWCFHGKNKKEAKKAKSINKKKQKTGNKNRK